MDNNTISRKITQDDFVTEKIDIMKNNLLGYYDDNGVYSITPQIVNELLDMKKLKKTSFGNSVFCIGDLLGYGEIVFELSFDGKTDDNAMAHSTLYVLEDVDKINGYLQNTIKTKIAEFSDSIDNFIEQSYMKFNIVTSSDDVNDEEGMTRKLSDELDESSFILAKKQYSLILNKLFNEKLLDAYGKYFTYRLSALTSINNDFSNAVLDRFNSEYNLIEKIFLNNKNYKMLNELLDKCIEEVSGTKEIYISQEAEFNEKIAPALESFVSNINKLNEKYENKALHMLDKEDRQKVEEIIDSQEEHNKRIDNELEDNDSDEVDIIPNNDEKIYDSDYLPTQNDEIPVIPTSAELESEEESSEVTEDLQELEDDKNIESVDLDNNEQTITSELTGDNDLVNSKYINEFDSSNLQTDINPIQDSLDTTPKTIDENIKSDKETTSVEKSDVVVDSKDVYSEPASETIESLSENYRSENPSTSSTINKDISEDTQAKPSMFEYMANKANVSPTTSSTSEDYSTKDLYEEQTIVSGVRDENPVVNKSYDSVYSPVTTSIESVNATKEDEFISEKPAPYGGFQQSYDNSQANDLSDGSGLEIEKEKENVKEENTDIKQGIKGNNDATARKGPSMSAINRFLADNPSQPSNNKSDSTSPNKDQLGMQENLARQVDDGRSL